MKYEYYHNFSYVHKTASLLCKFSTICPTNVDKRDKVTTMNLTDVPANV